MSLGSADALEFFGNTLADAFGLRTPCFFGDGVSARNDFAAQGPLSFEDVFRFTHGGNLLQGNLLQNGYGLFILHAYERNA